MESVKQHLAVGEMGVGDEARFWREPRHDGLDFLHARFRVHRYAPHTHETYVIGLLTAGAESYRLRGVNRVVRAGELCFVNPGDVHDGAPVGEGYAYRMTYPSISLLTELAEDLTGTRPQAAPIFPECVARDPEAAQLFLAAHRGIERRDGALAGDSRLFGAYSLLLLRYSDLGRGPCTAGGEARAVRRACDHLEAHYAEDVDLATLANVAGLGRTQLIQAFRRETGLTPHAWLTDRRVRAARALLRQGESAASAAAATGFFDQAHLTRAFKARIGVTPGVYARAGAGR